MYSQTRRPRSRRASVALIAAFCGLFLAAPGSALASTLEFYGGDGSNTSYDAVFSYSAGAGVGNNITATVTPSAVTISDVEAITANVTGSGGSCSGSGTTTVTCTPAPGEAISDSSSVFRATRGFGFGFGIDASDGNDVITVNGPVPTHVSGGDGNDLIAGSNDNAPQGQPDGTQSSGVEHLDGGSGTDAISGRGGNDSGDGGGTNSGPSTLNDDGDQMDLGAGNDFAVIEGAGDGVNDVLQGGPGLDEVSVFNSTNITSIEVQPDAFSANLATGQFAKVNNAPEGDTVAGFEDYDGSPGSNAVLGTATSNIIRGGSRTDAVNPLAGGDQVFLFGGNDSAETRDGFADRVDCGPGLDGVQVDQFDEPVDCERVTVTRVRPAGADVVAPTCKVTKLKGKYTRAAFFKGFTPKVSCSEATTLTMQVLVAVRRTGKLVTGSRAGDLVLAEKTYKLGLGNRGTKLKPSKRLGKNLPKRFKAVLRVTAQDEFGNRRVVTKRSAIKAKAKKAKKKSKKKGSKKRK